MDGQDPSQPTQATQTVLDPRRVGKQNSGFSDEEISDIICVLHPYSDAARQEVNRLAFDDCPYIIGKEEAETVEVDYGVEDDASRFQSNLKSHGNYALILRLSQTLKSPAAGFAFGRNPVRCDVTFVNDPRKRLSNVHFRIYVNEYGIPMIEDQSTNGTFVDGKLLSRAPKQQVQQEATRWVLSSGCTIRILLHDYNNDLSFRVRVPRREAPHDQAYLEKVREFFTKHRLRGTEETIKPGPTGHVDLFPRPPVHGGQRLNQNATVQQQRTPQKKREPGHTEWSGSGKYNRVGTLGKGAFAVVYKVTAKFNGMPYAAKELEKRRFVKNGIIDQKVENEMRIMEKINHPHIVRYIENFEWEDRLLIIIMDYVPHGDLGKLIMEDGPFREDMAQTMAKQLLSALGYLHNNNITHRDVKPDNILINAIQPLDVKLTDFGLSKMVDTEATFLRTFCGTLLYCAPEVYNEYAEYDMDGIRNRGQRARRPPGQGYSHAVDIWSLGGVLFYAMTGLPPYPVKNGISPSELLHKVMTTRLNPTPLQNHGVSETGIDFLSRMLQRRPENRATVVELEDHHWLSGARLQSIQPSQSYDEITDEDDIAYERRAPEIEYDRVSDSMGEDSEKENDVGNGVRPRLFGEVGSSALRSSGALPSAYLNLPDTSMGATEIMDSQSNGDQSMSGEPRQYRQTTVSIAQGQSADQLQSLVDNVASQSLGTRHVHVGNEINPSLSVSSIDFNGSKRKPPSVDTSEELEETPRGKHFMKRLKSHGDMENVSVEQINEYKLLARMPQVRRLGSGRQIDAPVTKYVFWKQDRRTWNLNYPEMTQLQYDAFCQIAKEMGGSFSPDETALWQLAMKYFPPMNRSLETHVAHPLLQRDEMMLETMNDMPSTAIPMDLDIPDTADPKDEHVLSVQDEYEKRSVGTIESDPQSCISTITFPITDSLVSFGRGPGNTQVFPQHLDGRIPKYAFKILLWKEGYDPSKDPSKIPHPWSRDDVDDPDSYSFWISTKASSGIYINGIILPSSNPKNHDSPSEQWTRLYDGDSLLIWGSPDQKSKTILTFRCSWGASAASRTPGEHMRPVSAETAQKLDQACSKTEKRIYDKAEKDRKGNLLKADERERLKNVESERDRSREFEKKRLEAIEYLSFNQAKYVSAKSRRGGAGSMPVLGRGAKGEL